MKKVKNEEPQTTLVENIFAYGCGALVTILTIAIVIASLALPCAGAYFLWVLAQEIATNGMSF